MDKEVLNEIQYELFIRFNNRYERGGRHIDVYFLDNPEFDNDELEQKKQLNIELLKKDTLEQLLNEPELLSLNREQIINKIDEIYRELQEIGKEIDDMSDEEIENLIYEKFLNKG